MRRFIIVIVALISLFNLAPSTLQAQEQIGSCEPPSVCVQSFFAGDGQFDDGNVHIGVFRSGEYGCLGKDPNTQCVVTITPLGGQTHTFHIPYLAPTSAMIPEDYCANIVALNPISSAYEYARGRLPAPYQSVTCVIEDEPSYVLIVINDDLVLHVTITLAFEDFTDPLLLLESLLGSDLSEFSSADTSDEGRNIPATTIGDIDISACSGLDETADAQCIADIAIENGEYTLCSAAIDVYACGASILEQIDDPCAAQIGDGAIACRVGFAIETGIEAACEQLPTEMVASCALYAGMTTGDTTVIDRHYPPGEGRDIAITTMALTLRDDALIEDIQDNEAHDNALIFLTVGSIADGEALEDSYCDRLRGNYNSDYPEDAQRNRDNCLQLTQWSRDMAKIEDEAEQMIFFAKIARELGDEELAQLAEEGAEAIRNGDDASLSDLFQQLTQP